jgi:hypothetical protein
LRQPFAPTVDLDGDLARHAEAEGVGVGVGDRPDALVRLEANDLRPQPVGLVKALVVWALGVEPDEFAKVFRFHGREPTHGFRVMSGGRRR